VEAIIENVAVPTVSIDEAVIRWQEQGFSTVELEVISSDGERVYPTDIQTHVHSVVRFRRAHFRKLKRDTEYQLTFSSGGQILCAKGESVFSTLPNPNVERSGTIAVVADPHLTRDGTFRKGRLLGASFRLFEETLQRIRSEAHDVVVIPGDLADRGEEAAYMHAERCLARFPGKSLVVPGNRDNLQLIRRYFPDVFQPQLIEVNGWTLIGLDTSSQELPSNAVVWLKKILESRERQRVLVFTHYALTRLSGRDSEQAIVNDRFVQEALNHRKKVFGVFSGHQNAVFMRRLGNTAHVVCPQIVHYPCAWNVIELYPNGFLCWIREIEDPYLIHLSQCEGDRWLSPEWSRQRIGALSDRSFAHFPTL